MARIRTIKPEFWTDGVIGEVSPIARLLFIASWNFADDEGGLDRSAKQLKAQAFPHDVIDCEPLVLELVGAGLFIEYQVGGKIYLHIKNFRKHQKIENPSLPRIPPYKTSSNNPLELTEESPSPQTGREGKGKGREKEVRERASVATRLPTDFQLTPERRRIAESEHLDAERTFAKFVDYWRGASGAKARKHDWDATWRNWCRTEADRSRGNGSSQDAAAQRRQAGIEAAWNRVQTHAREIGCPLTAREHESAEAFETRVKLWEQHDRPRRATTGLTPVAELLPKVTAA